MKGIKLEREIREVYIELLDLALLCERQAKVAKSMAMAIQDQELIAMYEVTVNDLDSSNLVSGDVLATATSIVREKLDSIYEIMRKGNRK